MSVHAESSSAARPKARKAVHPADVQHATDAGLDLLRVIGRLVLHNVSLPNRPELAIDHVVAGPSGVYVINTIAPTGSVTMSSGLLVCAGQPMMDEIDEVAGAAAVLRDLLSGAPVAPILCFHRSAEVAGVVGEVAVCSTENILELLSSQPDVVDAKTQREVMRVLSDSLVQAERRVPKVELEPVSKPRHRQKGWSLRRSAQADAPKAAVAPAAPPRLVVEPPPPPVAVAPVVKAPVVKAPVVKAPVVEAPVVAATVVEAPVAETPVVEAPVVEAPVVEVPVAETPVVEAPVVEAPVFEAPIAEARVAEAPVVEVPVAEVPVAEVPAAETPVVQTPVVETPVAEAPVAEVPVVETPVAEAPVVEAPQSEAPQPEVVLHVVPEVDSPPVEPVVETRVEFGVVEALVAGYASVLPFAPRVVESDPDPDPDLPASPAAHAPARPAARPPARSAGNPPADVAAARLAARPVEQSFEFLGEVFAMQRAKAGPVWRSGPPERPRAVLTTEPVPAPRAVPDPEAVPDHEALSDHDAAPDPAPDPAPDRAAGRRFTLPHLDVRPVLKKAGGVLAQLAPAEPVESVSALRETAAPVREVPAVTTPPVRRLKVSKREKLSQVVEEVDEGRPTRRRFANLVPAVVAALVVGAVLLVSPEVPAAVNRGVDWGKGLFTDGPTPVAGSLISVGGTAVDPAYDVTASAPVPVSTNGNVRAGHRLVAVKLRIHNNGTTQLELPLSSRLKVLDVLGIGYQASTTVKRTNLGPSLPKLVTVGPGATLVGSVVFSVPKSRDVGQIQLRLPDADDGVLAWDVPAT